VSGGYVYAEGGKYAAGIGSGCENSSSGSHGGTLTVTGGYVEAHGGEDGAGIGGGEDSDGATVNISGGEVRAYGNDYGAGIGGGEDGNGGNVTITGGIVIAESGGDQRAIGAGYGSDNHGSLSFADNMGVFVTTNLYRSVRENRVKDCRNFAYVRINQCAHGGATIAIVSGEKHSVTGCDYCYADQEDHTFGDYGECSACHLVSLADNADNSKNIAHWENTEKSVTLTGRTLFKDGNWNTLCLPFGLASLTGTPLDGATLKELDTETEYSGHKTSFDSDGTLYLYFKNATAIEAGKPYLVKWGSGSNVTDPVFNNVTINSTQADITSADGKVSFKGIYDPETLDGGDASNLYLGAGNNLYWPSADVTLNAFRAYFTVALGDDESGESTVREIRMNLDDGGVTEVQEFKSLKVQGASAWYDLFGRKLNGKPTAPGVYMNNGRKIAITK
jgi:hypothetical protein